MAGTKFSGFTTGATTANTKIVGYDSGASTNNQYTLAQLAAGISPSLTIETIFSTSPSSVVPTGQIIDITDSIELKASGSGYSGFKFQPSRAYPNEYSKMYIDNDTFLTKYPANEGYSFGVGNTSNSFHFNTNVTTTSDGYAMRVHANTDSPYGALILKGYGTSTAKNFTVQDSGANEVFSIQDDGLVTVANNLKVSGQTYNDGVHDIGTIAGGGTATPVWDNGNIQKLTIDSSGGAAAITLANAASTMTAGATYILIIIQGGTAAGTISSYGTHYKFPGATAPTLTTGTANQADVITMVAYSSTVLMSTSTLNFVTS